MYSLNGSLRQKLDRSRDPRRLMSEASERATILTDENRNGGLVESRIVIRNDTDFEMIEGNVC